MSVFIDHEYIEGRVVDFDPFIGARCSDPCFAVAESTVGFFFTVAGYGALIRVPPVNHSVYCRQRWGDKLLGRRK